MRLRLLSINMRILHLNNYFADRFFYNNLYERQIRDNDISVVMFVNYNYRPKREYESYVMIFKCFGKLDKYLFFPRLFKSEKVLLRTIDIHNYDIIHSYSLFTNGSIARKLAQKGKIPFVVTVRNVDVNIVFKKMFFLRKYGRKLLLDADKVIFLSEGVKELVKERYCRELEDKKCTVIPNGVDDFWLKNKANEPKRRNENNLTILYAGDINRNKNLLRVAKALQKIKYDGGIRHIEYEVVGDVCDDLTYNELQKYDFVSIVGRLPKEELIEHYRKADIYIMISFKESFGLTYVEAMSQGLPIIYTKGQGFDGQFEEGKVGYHVDPNSEEDLINKVYQILARYQDISKECIEKSELFSWEIQTKKTYCMYLEAIGDTYAKTD